MGAGPSVYTREPVKTLLHITTLRLATTMNSQTVLAATAAFEGRELTEILLEDTTTMVRWGKS